MKNLLVLLIFLSTNVLALDACMTGSWYDPESPGSGINVEVLDGMVVAYYYKPTKWFSMDGENTDDLAVLNVYHTSREATRRAGGAVLEVIDQNTMTFEYILKWDFTRLDEGAAIPWCFSGCFGEFVYTRLTQPIACN